MEQACGLCSAHAVSIDCLAETCSGHINSRMFAHNTRCAAVGPHCRLFYIFLPNGLFDDSLSRT